MRARISSGVPCRTIRGLIFFAFFGGRGVAVVEDSAEAVEGSSRGADEESGVSTAGGATERVARSGRGSLAVEGRVVEAILGG